MRAWLFHLAAGSALASVATLGAMDSHIVGPRALGMGGVGTATAHDHNASFWNPAMYGWFWMTNADGGPVPADANFIGRKDWGVGLLDLGVAAEVQGQLADWIDRLAQADVSRLQNLGTAQANPRDIEWALTALDAFNRFVPDRDFVSVQAQLSVLNIRVWRLGLGVRQFAEALVGFADVDRVNLGFGTNTLQQVVNDINQTPMPAGYSSAHQPTVFVPGTPTYTFLYNALGGGAAADEAIRRMDFAAQQAGITQQQVDSLVGATGAGPLIQAINGSGFNASTSIANNQTAAIAIAYTATEVPLTFGWPIDERFAVGGNLRLIVGQIGAAKVRLARDTDDLSQYVQDSLENAQQSITGSIDLGVAARWGWGQLGLTGRNLSFPTLEGSRYQDADGEWFRVDDIELEPQVAAGIALYPHETLCFAAEIDVTENRTRFRTVSERPALPPGTQRELEFETASQRLGLGAEWDILRVLALRAGGSYDFAAPEPAWMLHAGLGLDLWLIRFDVGAALSTKTISINKEEYPQAFAVAAGAAIDF
ncbi:MAG: conjugal transfer protein TraF [Planctomycetes bacterium]|nr:conjugal transfer protein TraF [Planctomycetota bacterium]